MKYLILLDRKFPFKTGEAFLENEIDEISKYFDKIYIYASDVKTGEKQTRVIKSTNVEARFVENKDFKKRKYNYMLSSPKYFFKCKDKGNLKKKIIESYFLSASYNQAKKIINDLQTISFNKSDQIYIYSYWFYVNAKVGCILKDYFKNKGYNTVLLSRAHAFDIYEEKRKYGYLPQRIELLKHLDVLVPCSDNGTEYFKKKYPDYKNKIVTGYLGTYDHGLKNYKKHSGLNIVSCSRLSDVKRVNLILDALKNLDDKSVNISWTHIGGGDNYDLLKQRSENELKNIKVNLTGAIPNTDVYNYYLNNDVDLFINVSSSEGLPVSIMEAISFGIPVIATDVGGTSEIVGSDNGYLLDSNFQVNELSDLIMKFYNMNIKEYTKYRLNSRKKWEDKFQAEKNYKIFSNIFLDIKK